MIISTGMGEVFDFGWFFLFVLKRGRSPFHFSGVIIVYLKVCFLSVNLNGEIRGSHAC